MGTSFRSPFASIKLIILAVAGLFCASYSHGAPPSGDLRLTGAVTTELNKVLLVCDNLHKALVAQNEEQVDMGLRELVVQLDRARKVSTQVKAHERGHLWRILTAAHEQFELMQSSIGEERRSHLIEGFNQVVNLARIYRLDRAYGIYFCPKDQTTWIQRGSRAHHPFRRGHDREHCAMRVPK